MLLRLVFCVDYIKSLEKKVFVEDYFMRAERRYELRDAARCENGIFISTLGGDAIYETVFIAAVPFMIPLRIQSTVFLPTICFGRSRLMPGN